MDRFQTGLRGILGDISTRVFGLGLPGPVYGPPDPGALALAAAAAIAAAEALARVTFTDRVDVVELRRLDLWQAAGDERTCLVCSPYAGIELDQLEGPFPPLHPNCRCMRVLSRIEYQSTTTRDYERGDGARWSEVLSVLTYWA